MDGNKSKEIQFNGFGVGTDGFIICLSFFYDYFLVVSTYGLV